MSGLLCRRLLSKMDSVSAKQFRQLLNRRRPVAVAPRADIVIACGTPSVTSEAAPCHSLSSEADPLHPLSSEADLLHPLSSPSSPSAIHSVETVNDVVYCQDGDDDGCHATGNDPDDDEMLLPMQRITLSDQMGDLEEPAIAVPFGAQPPSETILSEEAPPSPPACSIPVRTPSGPCKQQDRLALPTPFKSYLSCTSAHTPAHTRPHAAPSHG